MEHIETQGHRDLPFGCVYLGEQERGPGKYSLEMYTDLQTGSTFLRMPFESLEQAVGRIRAGFEIDPERMAIKEVSRNLFCEPAQSGKEEANHDR